MVNHCFAQNEATRETFVSYVCAALQASEESKAQNCAELLANIRRTFENTNYLTGIFYDYRCLGLLSKQETRQSSEVIFLSLFYLRNFTDFTGFAEHSEICQIL